jgi:hypothetical protein
MGPKEDRQQIAYSKDVDLGKEHAASNKKLNILFKNEPRIKIEYNAVDVKICKLNSEIKILQGCHFKPRMGGMVCNFGYVLTKRGERRKRVFGREI